MNILRRIRWWLGQRTEAEALAEEVAFHEAMKRRELEERGLSPDQAKFAAKRAMGNAVEMREESRAVWIAPWLDRLAQDVRFALRSARSHLAFSVGVVGITALGIGATSTIFTVVDAVILKPLPYPSAERLVYFDYGSHSPPRFRDWQREMTSVELWGAAWTDTKDLVGDGRPERLQTAQVSPDFFAMFGARPAIGRLFSAAEYQDDQSVILVSHRLWVRRFGADSAVLGRALDIGGKRARVIGVIDPAFVEPELISTSSSRGAFTDVWFPLVLSPEIAADHRYSILQIAGRLQPGLSVDAFRTELTALAPRLAAANPDVHSDGPDKPFSIPVVPLQQAIIGDASKGITILFAAVGLMLLIACANVTNLYLARSTDRHRELAVRAALGAGRGRLVRQLLTESVTLGAIAGVLGVGLAMVGVKLLSSSYSGDLPRSAEIAVDGRVLLFALGVAVLTGMVFGLIPAWSMREERAYGAIKAGSPATGPKGGRLRAGLVVAEIAMALVLLVGSGLLFRSFLQIIRVDPGFDPAGLTLARLQLGEPFTAERRLAFAAAINDRLAKAPGVADVTVGVAGPMVRTGNSRCCWGHNKIILEGGKEVTQRVLIHPVGPRFFETVGTRLKGAGFAANESYAAPFPAVVSDRLAQKLFGDRDPIGAQFAVGQNKFTVRGVVTGFRQWGLDQEDESEFFVPYRQFGGDFDALNITARATNPAVSLAPVIRQAIAELEPTLPADDIAPVTEAIRTSLSGPRFYGVLMATFAGLALLLAAAGIYASMLYAVRQRTRELGIRIALGAKGADISRMVVGEAGRFAIAGVAAGGLGAVALGRALRASLFGIGPTDPIAFGAATGLLLGTVLVAAYWPARRAAQSSPLDVLRAE